MSFKLLRYDRMTLILCLEEKIISTPALSYYIYISMFNVNCVKYSFWSKKDKVYSLSILAEWLT